MAAFDWNEHRRARERRIKALPAVHAAEVAVQQAHARQVKIMKSCLPLGTELIVHHSRGHFYATIVGHCEFHDRGHVNVRNNGTGKTSRRYYSELELI